MELYLSHIVQFIRHSTKAMLRSSANFKWLSIYAFLLSALIGCLEIYTANSLRIIGLPAANAIIKKNKNKCFSEFTAYFIQ